MEKTLCGPKSSTIHTVMTNGYCVGFNYVRANECGISQPSIIVDDDGRRWMIILVFVCLRPTTS
jgi:hypothetical protein